MAAPSMTAYGSDSIKVRSVLADRVRAVAVGDHVAARCRGVSAAVRHFSAVEVARAAAAAQAACLNLVDRAVRPELARPPGADPRRRLS